MAKVRFGDVVKEYKGKIDQKNNPYEFYVAGDHMDTDDLTIRRRGRFVTDDVGPAFIREFKKGQILYGSRRTYLRKIAVADFDGVTANTTFVIETKDENKLLQRLIPFIMYTEDFTEWSIKKSKGSTNPYVLFKDLANYEFTLPELETQRKLADVLWAMNDTMEAYKNLLAATDDMVKSRFLEMFGDPVENPMKWTTKPFLEIGNCKNGMNFHNNDTGMEIPCLGVGDFQDHSMITNVADLPMISINYMPSNEYLLKDDDIVFVRSNGNKALVGRCVAVYPGNIPTTFSGFCIRYRKQDNSIIIPYLLRVLKTGTIRAKLAGRGANIQNLNQKILGSLSIPIPPIELQKTFATFVTQVDKSKSELQRALTELTALYKRILQDNLM